MPTMSATNRETAAANMRILAREPFRGSLETKRLVASECRRVLGSSGYKKNLDALRVDSDAAERQHLRKAVKAYEDELNHQRTVQLVFKGNVGLLKGALTTATIVAAPTGFPAIALAGATWLLDTSADLAQQAIEKEGRRQAREILGTQLASYKKSKPNTDFSEFHGEGAQKAREVLKVLHASNRAVAEELEKVDRRDKDLVNGFLLHELQETVLAGDLEQLKLIERSEGEIKALGQRVVGVSKGLRDYASSTDKQMREIKIGQERIKKRVDDIFTRVKKQGVHIQKNRQTLEFLETFMFGNMTPAEQLTALKSGFGPNRKWTKEDKDKLALLAERDRLKARVADYLNGGAALVNIAAKIPGVDKEAVRRAGRVVSTTRTAFRALAALSTGNVLQAATAIAGLFGGRTDVAAQRHTQILGRLEDLSFKSDAILKQTAELRRGQHNILKGIAATYEAILSVGEEIGRLHVEQMDKLDELQKDVLFNRRVALSLASVNVCDTFLDSRAKFYVEGQFPDYESMREHYKQNRIATFEPGLQRLSTSFSFRDRINDQLFLETLQRGAAIKDGVRSFRNRIYTPTFDYITTNFSTVTKLPGERLEAFFQAFFLPARTIDDVPKFPTKRIASRERLGASMSEHMIDPLAPSTVTRHVDYALEFVPYIELLDGTELYPLDKIVSRRTVKKDDTLAEKALTIVEIAIAQQAMLTGHLTLRFVDEAYAASGEAGKQHLAKLTDDQLELLPKLARNFVLYRVKRELADGKHSTLSYDIARTDKKKGSLKAIIDLPWKYAWVGNADGRGSGGWGVIIGELKVPLPTGRRVRAGLIEYPADMSSLLSRRAALAGWLAGHDFVEGPKSSAALRRSVNRSVLKAV